MPAILVVIGIFFGFLFAILYIIPMISTAVVSASIGKKAKFTSDKKIDVFVWTYFGTGAVLLLFVIGTGGVKGIGTLIAAFLSCMFWPFLLSVMTYNAVHFFNVGSRLCSSETKNATIFWLVYSAGLSIGFYRAVKIVLNRAERETSERGV